MGERYHPLDFATCGGRLIKYTDSEIVVISYFKSMHSCRDISSFLMLFIIP